MFPSDWFEGLLKVLSTYEIISSFFLSSKRHLHSFELMPFTSYVQDHTSENSPSQTDAVKLHFFPLLSFISPGK